MVIKAYTDGSYKNGIYGSGAVVLDEKNREIEKLYSGGEDLSGIRNIAGEIEAVKGVLAYAYKLKSNGGDITDVVIYHDYIGLQKWADGEWKTNKIETTNYKEYVRRARTHFRVIFQKVEAHSGNQHNEIADALAKQGIEAFIKAQFSVVNSVDTTADTTEEDIPVKEELATLYDNLVKLYEEQGKQIKKIKDLINKIA